MSDRLPSILLQASLERAIRRGCDNQLYYQAQDIEDLLAALTERNATNLLVGS